jgi:hypothetical protein
VYLGKTPGGNELQTKVPPAGATSIAITGLPTDGSNIYVRLASSFAGNQWTHIDYTYKAADEGEVGTCIAVVEEAKDVIVGPQAGTAWIDFFYGCWGDISASSNASWLTIPSPHTKSGHGPVYFTVTANPSSFPRLATITLMNNGTEEVIDRVTVQQNGGATCLSSEYRAEYFANRDFQGTPVVRCETWPIRHDWGYTSPVSGIPADSYTVRWTGRAYIAAGTYDFVVRTDDGIKVWLDGTLILSAWWDQGPTEHRVRRTVAGGTHDIKIEYYENSGYAAAEFRWEQASAPSITKTMSIPGNIRWVDTGIDLPYGKLSRSPQLV